MNYKVALAIISLLAFDVIFFFAFIFKALVST
jgi:hypothetical protein